jgi:hypothetical protein
MAYNCTNPCGIRRRTVLLGWQSLFTKVFTSPRLKFTQRNISTFLVLFSVYLFGGLECVGHSTPYVAHFVFLRDLHSNPDTCSGSQAVTSDQSPALSLWYTDWEKDEKFSQTLTLIHLILYCSSAVYPILKGTVSRDFRLLLFFMNQFPPSP